MFGIDRVHGPEARLRERFEGRAGEPRPGLQSGHLRGATGSAFTSLTGLVGGFAIPDQLRVFFGDLSPTPPVVACAAGITTCVLALRMMRIGQASRLYVGSWG